VKVERRGTMVRVFQGGRLLATVSGVEGPRKLLVGARGEATFKDLWVAGFTSPAELARRLGPLERLEGGAHVGDFRLDIPPPDSESLSRASMAEAALEAGLLEEAWTLADEAAAKSPGAGLPIAIRALIRLAQGESRLAVSDADLALALDPGSGDVAMRARRVLAAARGSGPSGAFRQQQAGPWVVRTDRPPERLAHFAGKLEEAARGFAEALKEAGPAPQGIQVTIFTSRETLLSHLETAANEPAVADVLGAEAELTAQAARAYIRKASPAAPAWLEAGLGSHLARDRRHEDMPDLLAQSAPLEALVRKPLADFTESDRVQSASLVRFMLGGAYKSIIPDLLRKLRNGVPAIEAFSGLNLKKMDSEWRAWVPGDK
jgi:tetratricopeptide (TPR) repeat protein